MTLVLRPLSAGHHKRLILLECGLITDCYNALTNLVWTLMHDFGTRTLVLGVQ